MLSHVENGVVKDGHKPQQQRNNDKNNNNIGVQRKMENNQNNQNKNSNVQNRVKKTTMRRMKEKGDMLPDYVSTVDVRKGKTPVRLSNSNGSSHKGEAHGREEEYESVLPKKNSIKTASMGESELESTDGDEGDMEEEKDVETTKKSSSKTSSKKRETEEEKEQRLKKEKEDEKIAAKIAKREAKALERVHETVADLPVIKDKLATAPPHSRGGVARRHKNDG